MSYYRQINSYYKRKIKPKINPVNVFGICVIVLLVVIVIYAIVYNLVI